MSSPKNKIEIYSRLSPKNHILPFHEIASEYYTFPCSCHRNKTPHHHTHRESSYPSLTFFSITHLSIFTIQNFLFLPTITLSLSIWCVYAAALHSFDHTLTLIIRHIPQAKCIIIRPRYHYISLFYIQKRFYCAPMSSQFFSRHFTRRFCTPYLYSVRARRDSVIRKFYYFIKPVAMRTFYSEVPIIIEQSFEQDTIVPSSNWQIELMKPIVSL